MLATVQADRPASIGRPGAMRAEQAACRPAGSDHRSSWVRSVFREGLGVRSPQRLDGPRGGFANGDPGPARVAVSRGERVLAEQLAGREVVGCIVLPGSGDATATAAMLSFPYGCAIGANQ